VGTIEAIGIALVVGAGAGALGLWFRGSAIAGRWVAAAPCALPVAERTPPPALRLAPAAWPSATGAGAAVVTLALLVGRHEHFAAGFALSWATAGLVVWACGLSLLALVDQETLMLPSKLVRSCAFATTGLLLVSAVTGSWRYVGRGAACALAGYVVFGTWAVLRPQSLGFGDVRMASLVALGAGALSAQACLVALVTAPVLAASVPIFGRKLYKTRPTGHPVALGPFLAAGGIAAVVFSAI